MNKQITFVLPPPNVTGSLHIGHALDITIQDIKARWFKSKGFDINWIPGSDHAGIATQLVAERALKAEGRTKNELSPEGFLEYIWKIKEDHECKIQEQVKKMETVINWDAYCFTMDEKRNEAVRFAFVELYKKGLIYRAERFVYWDPMLQTACSDLEVDFKNQKGKFYYVKYELVEGGYIEVATTRPETIFSDVALCVNPENEHYKHLVGKYAYVPGIKRKIPIIADEQVELDKGTGVLKITPAHDILDYEIGAKHGLEVISSIDKQGRLINVPEDFMGLTVAEGKDKMAAFLEDLGQLIKIEDIEHAVPHGEKSGCQLEYIVTKQWFVDAEKLAGKALSAVHSKEIELIPEFFINTYNHWLEDIQPWCISRQIAWGHRIPVWYGPNGEIFVGMTEEEVRKEAGSMELTQETDVLDTWFSSALWPFAVQGYPKEKPVLPMSFLVTGRDILFFWVARMIMMSIELCDQIPFKEVYLHGLVLDKHGKKMSKVVGNVINPLDIIEQYNADILKLALIKKALPGRDVRFSENDLELARNFLTKMQNAFDFARSREVEQTSDSHPWASWIISQCHEMEKNFDEMLEKWELAQAIQDLEKFARDKFCGWFLEACKHIKHPSMNVALHYVASRIVSMLEPYAPSFASKQKFTLLDLPTQVDFETALKEQAYIQKARSVLRMNFNKNIFVEAEKLDLDFLSKMSHANFALGDTNIAYVFEKGKIFLTLDEGTQIFSITTRLEKEIAEHTKLIDQANARLNNEKFIENAAQDIIDEMRERLEEQKTLCDEKSELFKMLCDV